MEKDKDQKKRMMWAWLGFAVIMCSVTIAFCSLYVLTDNSLFAWLCGAFGVCEFVGVGMFAIASNQREL